MKKARAVGMWRPALFLACSLNKPPPQNQVGPPLHCLLFVCEHDCHLFKRDLVESAGNLDVLRCLILFQRGAGAVVKFAGLLTSIEASIFENLLGLLNLVLVSSEDWFPGFCCCS